MDVKFKFEIKKYDVMITRVKINGGLDWFCLNTMN